MGVPVGDVSRGVQVKPAIAIALGALLLAAGPARAQYFGRNKVQSARFDFQILETPHFDLYYYPAERETARLAGRLAERWYDRLSVTLDHRFTRRQPIILYASHAHFAQTTVLSEMRVAGVENDRLPPGEAMIERDRQAVVPALGEPPGEARRLAFGRVVVQIEMRRLEDLEIETRRLYFVAPEVLRAGRPGCQQQCAE